MKQCFIFLLFKGDFMKNIIILLTMCILLAGCTSPKESMQKKAGILLTEKTYLPEFSQALLDNMLDHGYLAEEIDIRYCVREDPQADIERISEFIEEGVDMMFAQLPIRDGWQPRLDAMSQMATIAAEADVPLVFLGDKPTEEEMTKWEDNDWRVAFVGNDYLTGTSTAGQALSTKWKDVNGNGMVDCVLIKQFDTESEDYLINPVFAQMAENKMEVNLVDTLYTSTWTPGYAEAIQDYFAKGNTWNNNSYNEIVSGFPRFSEEFPSYWQENLDDIEVVLYTLEADGLGLIANTKTINENVWTVWCDTFPWEKHGA